MGGLHDRKTYELWHGRVLGHIQYTIDQITCFEAHAVRIGNDHRPTEKAPMGWSKLYPGT
jgi:hypothetical protein